MRKLTGQILWLIIAIYAFAVLLPPLFPKLESPFNAAINTAALCVFALIHASLRYRIRDVAGFVVLCLVVSNFMENLSIMTGFPFGHYHYTDALGPKLFLVPVLIGPAYFANGYFAWVIGNILVGELRRGSSTVLTVAVPFIAAFVMVMWDLTFDPRASTIQHQWIWEQGGGYFGVPLTNYLGWFFTVYLFLQLFALFVRFRPGNETAETFPRSHYAQALLTYAVMGLTPVLTFVIGGSNAQITDAAGVVWQTRSIAESVATVSIYTMLFAVALSAVKLIQAPATAPGTSAHEATSVTRGVLTAAR